MIYGVLPSSHYHKGNGSNTGVFIIDLIMNWLDGG